MNVRSIGIILIVGFSVMAVQASAEDSIAYSSGGLVAELTLEAWIQAAKRERVEVIVLARKLAAIASDYADEYNDSFVRGIIDSLSNKNILVHVRESSLNAYQSMLVVACYYCWFSQLMHALELQMLDSSNDVLYRKQAVIQAVTDVYGFAEPELVADITYALENDQLGLSNCPL